MSSLPFRLKDSPEDFRVVERTEFSLDGGPFAVYTLRKRDIGTLEALDELVPRSFATFGGLKDKYALSEQHVTIENGRRENAKSESAELEYLGQASRPFESRDISANAFTIVLRDVDAETATRLDATLASVSEWRIPNYFDEQRFGSLGESGVFAAEPWCRGDWETAIRVVLTDPNPHDQSSDRREKRLLAEHWNAWHELPLLGDPVRHAVVWHLANRPGDFRGAIARIPHSRRSLLLSAFQSALWNRLLSAVMESLSPDSSWERFSIADTALAMPQGSDGCEFLDGLQLPLPSARQQMPDGPIVDHMNQIMKDYELEYRQLRVKYPRDTFFSKGARPAGFQAVDLNWSTDDDERFPNRKKLTLSFDLPRGCYATMFIRRLAASLF